MSNDKNSKKIETCDNNENKKKQRQRSVFDLEQIRHLEYVFVKITHYPDLSVRQHLTLLTQLPDKKIQIWFQNRRAKWRKQYQLGHFGGLHELTFDKQSNFVPAPKPNFVSSPTTTFSNNPSMNPQEFEYLFYLAFQTALATKSNSIYQNY